MELAVLKTLAGFLNAHGGKLVIGVADDGRALGIERDKFPNEDKLNLHLVNLVRNRIGSLAMSYIHTHFEDFNGKRVLVIDCKRSPQAVFVKDGKTERFYVRMGPSTAELSASETHAYTSIHFSGVQSA